MTTRKINYPKNRKSPSTKSRGRRPRWYTDEHINFIKENYGQMSAREIGEKLGKSRSAIEHVIQRYKIERTTDQRKFDTKGSSYGMKYSAYKSAAKNRDYSFDLTKEEFITLVQQDCYYCSEPPKLVNPWKAKSMKASRRFKAEADILFNGIDRVDNDKGYCLENCVPCCFVCNKMKLELPLTDFMEKIEKIYSKHNKKDGLISVKKVEDAEV